MGCGSSSPSKPPPLVRQPSRRRNTPKIDDIVPLAQVLSHPQSSTPKKLAALKLILSYIHFHQVDAEALLRAGIVTTATHELRAFNLQGTVKDKSVGLCDGLLSILTFVKKSDNEEIQNQLREVAFVALVVDLVSFPHPTIRAKALNILLETVSRPQDSYGDVHLILNTPSIAQGLVNALRDSDAAVSEKAAGVIATMSPLSSDIREEFISEQAVDCLGRVCLKGSFVAKEYAAIAMWQLCTEKSGKTAAVMSNADPLGSLVRLIPPPMDETLALRVTVCVRNMVQLKNSHKLKSGLLTAGVVKALADRIWEGHDITIKAALTAFRSLSDRLSPIHLPEFVDTIAEVLHAVLETGDDEMKHLVAGILMNVSVDERVRARLRRSLPDLVQFLRPFASRGDLHAVLALCILTGDSEGDVVVLPLESTTKMKSSAAWVLHNIVQLLNKLLRIGKSGVEVSHNVKSPMSQAVTDITVPICALRCLAAAEKNRLLFMDNKLPQTLHSLLSWDELGTVALTEIAKMIWSLSFGPVLEIQPLLNSGAIGALRELASDSEDLISKEAKGYAKGALQNVGKLPRAPSIKISRSPSGSLEETHAPIAATDVFLSYNRGSEQTVSFLSDSLEAVGFTVHMASDPIEGAGVAMRDHVNNSTVFVACLNHCYKQSPRVREEADYAVHTMQEGFVIPVLLENSYVPDGWVSRLFPIDDMLLLTEIPGSSGYGKQVSTLIEGLERCGLRGDRRKSSSLRVALAKMSNRTALFQGAVRKVLVMSYWRAEERRLAGAEGGADPKDDVDGLGTDASVDDGSSLKVTVSPNRQKTVLISQDEDIDMDEINNELDALMSVVPGE